jgi:ATP-binding cassette subfamily B protein
MNSLRNFFSKFTLGFPESSLYLKDYFDFLDISSDQHKEDVSLPDKISSIQDEHILAYPEIRQSNSEGVSFRN